MNKVILEFQGIPTNILYFVHFLRSMFAFSQLRSYMFYIEQLPLINHDLRMSKSLQHPLQSEKKLFLARYCSPIARARRDTAWSIFQDQRYRRKISLRYRRRNYSANHGTPRLRQLFSPGDGSRCNGRSSATEYPLVYTRAGRRETVY